MIIEAKITGKNWMRPTKKEKDANANRLKKHWDLMQGYMKKGHSKEEASTKAYDNIKNEDAINELSDKILHRYVKRARKAVSNIPVTFNGSRKKTREYENRYLGLHQAKRKLHHESWWTPEYAEMIRQAKKKREKKEKKLYKKHKHKHQGLTAIGAAMGYGNMRGEETMNEQPSKESLGKAKKLADMLKGVKKFGGFDVDHSKGISADDIKKGAEIMDRIRKMRREAVNEISDAKKLAYINASSHSIEKRKKGIEQATKMFKQSKPTSPPQQHQQRGSAYTASLQMTQKRRWGDETEVNELGHGTLNRYSDAAFTQADWLDKPWRKNNPQAKRILKNRKKGMDRARDRLSKEEKEVGYTDKTGKFWPSQSGKRWTGYHGRATFLPGAGPKGRTKIIGAGKSITPKEETINEGDVEALTQYRRALAHRAGMEGKNREALGTLQAIDKKIADAKKKQKEIKKETVNELSHEKLGQYAKKSLADIVRRSKPSHQSKDERKIANREKGFAKAIQQVGKEETVSEGAYRASDDRHAYKVNDYVKTLEKQGHKVTGTVMRDDSTRSHETDIYYKHKKTGTEKSKRVATRMSYEETEIVEGTEENRAREKARRDKNTKKWKQNTDRWAKWKNHIRAGNYRNYPGGPLVPPKYGAPKEETVNELSTGLLKRYAAKADTASLRAQYKNKPKTEFKRAAGAAKARAIVAKRDSSGQQVNFRKQAAKRERLAHSGYDTTKERDMDMKEGLTLTRLRQIMGEDNGTNWGGNQSSTAGPGKDLSGPKKNKQPKQQTQQPPKQQAKKQDEPLDPEDKVKLGGKTPVIVNPTLAQTASVATDKDMKLAKSGKGRIERPVTESSSGARLIMALGAYAMRHRIGRGIRSVLGTDQSRTSSQERPTRVTAASKKLSGVTVGATGPKMKSAPSPWGARPTAGLDRASSAKEREAARTAADSAVLHKSIVDRGQQRKAGMDAWHKKWDNDPQSLAAKKNFQSTTVDKPIGDAGRTSSEPKPEKPALSLSKIKSGQKIKAPDYLKLVSNNPKMKRRWGNNEETDLDEISFRQASRINKRMHPGEIRSYGQRDDREALRNLRKDKDWGIYGDSKAEQRRGQEYEAEREAIKKKVKKEETIRRVIGEATGKSFKKNLATSGLGGASKSKGKAGAKGQDTEGDQHPINVARKAVDLRSPVTLKHSNKETTSISPNVGHKVLQNYGKLQRPHEKEAMVSQIWGSAKGLSDHLEGKKHSPKPVHWALKGIPRA
jgi:hypothetical protein